MLIVRINFERNPEKSIQQLIGDTVSYMYEIKDLRVIAKLQEETWCVSTHDRADFEPGWTVRCIDRVHVSKSMPKAFFYLIPSVFIELEYAEK